MTELHAEDIAEMRRQGDFRAYLRQITGRDVEAQPQKPVLSAAPDLGYRVAHTGGWPLGTAATGPTPPPDTCTCAKCGGNPASRSVHRTEGEAA